MATTLVDRHNLKQHTRKNAKKANDGTGISKAEAWRRRGPSCRH
ncbi:hypothetical protein [Arthrobacter psychrolactophilus]